MTALCHACEIMENRQNERAFTGHAVAKFPAGSVNYHSLSGHPHYWAESL